MVVICQWKALGASFQNLASKSGNPGKNPEKIRIFGSVIQTAISSPFFKKKCRCHAFANCEFMLFQVKNGTNLHASNVNISACGRFIKLPITPLSQNVMDWAVKLQYNLGKMQSEAKNTQKHAFWLEIDGNWLFLRSKTPISQVLDIETKNGRKFWKIWEKI